MHWGAGEEEGGFAHHCLYRHEPVEVKLAAGARFMRPYSYKREKTTTVGPFKLI